MGSKTSIEWTGATWTPIRARYLEIQNDGSGKERIGWHCEHASEGCRNCYSEGINRRLGTGLDFKPANLYRPEREGYRNGEAKLFLDERMLLAPLRWKAPRMVFVCSMTDLFADFVPDAFIAQVMMVCQQAPQHTFQILTKRPARMRKMISAVWLDDAPPSNIWLGCSVEDQRNANERIPDLLATPAATRFISAEPLLGPLDLWLYLDPLRQFRRHLDLVIIGGESGPQARDFRLSWAKSLIEQCRAANVPAFMKQVGSNAWDDISYAGSTPAFKTRDRKGGDPAEWPEDLRVREMPA